MFQVNDRQCRIYNCAKVCLNTGRRWPGGGGGGHLPANFCFVTMDVCLCGTILNLKAYCFGAIPDIMIELTACVGLPGLPPSGPK